MAAEARCCLRPASSRCKPQVVSDAGSGARTVQLGAEGEAASPGVDGRHWIGGCFPALLVLPPVPRHRACTTSAGGERMRERHARTLAVGCATGMFVTSLFDASRSKDCGRSRRVCRSSHRALPQTP